jgi:hypothetical protein
MYAGQEWNFIVFLTIFFLRLFWINISWSGSLFQAVKQKPFPIIVCRIFTADFASALSFCGPEDRLWARIIRKSIFDMLCEQ